MRKFNYDVICVLHYHVFAVLQFIVLDRLLKLWYFLKNYYSFCKCINRSSFIGLYTAVQHTEQLKGGFLQSALSNTELLPLILIN